MVLIWGLGMNRKQWLNGRITVYHGNCFDVMRDLDCKVDAIITDPPYGILNHKIETGIDIEAFLTSCKKILNDNSFIIYFGQQPMLTDWNVLANNIFNYKNEVIWYKRQNSSPFQKMGRVFENIMIYENGLGKYKDIKRKYTDVKRSLAEYEGWDSLQRNLSSLDNLATEKNFQELREFLKNGIMPMGTWNSSNNETFIKQKATSGRSIAVYKVMTEGSAPRNLVSFNERKFKSNKFQHPTIKPLALMSYLIELCTNKDDIIFDGFLGSGTTAAACIRTGRRFVGCELDEGYFNGICERLDDETKQLTLF